MSATMQIGTGTYGRETPYATELVFTVAGSCECDGTGDYLCDECKRFAASAQVAPEIAPPRTYGWTKDGAS